MYNACLTVSEPTAIYKQFSNELYRPVLIVKTPTPYDIHIHIYGLHTFMIHCLNTIENMLASVPIVLLWNLNQILVLSDCLTLFMK